MVAQKAKVYHSSLQAQPYQIRQASMNTHYILFREVYNLVSLVAREGPRTTNQLGSATFRKSLQLKKTGKTSTLRKPPFSVRSSSPPDEALCSRKIYTFPTQMSFPDQLLEGQAALNPRPLLRAPSPHTRAGLSSLCRPLVSPRGSGALAQDPARGQGCPTESARGSRPGRL